MFAGYVVIPSSRGDFLTPCQSLINNEIEEITHKIEALDGLRTKLERDLLKLQEDELELDAERTRIRFLSWIQLMH